MGGGTKTAPASPYEAAMGRIAEQLFAETSPLRQSFLSQFGDVAGGGYDPTKDPRYANLFGIARGGMEKQYGVAREDILGGTPRGGGQIAALANLATSRAQDVGSLPSIISADLMSDLSNKAYGAAFQAPQTSLSGLSGAASAYGGRLASSQAAAAQQQAGLYQGLGMLGTGAGYALGGPLGAGIGKGATKAATK